MKYIKKFESSYDIDDLIDSIMYNNTRKIKKILNSGVDVNSYKERTYTALHMATIYRNKNIIDLLLKQGADINGLNTYNGQTSIMELAGDPEINSNKDILYYLIEKGADLSIKDYDGHDFFHILSHNDGVSSEDIKEITTHIKNSYPKIYKEYLIKKDLDKYNL